MSAARSAPLCQVRVIGTADNATALLAHITERARRLYGAGATYRTQTRSARRTGHLRIYLTVSRKENGPQ